MSRKIDLQVSELVKCFDAFTAVDRVSFDVHQGKFFSILGPSGCGKTTLLRMISGFVEPTSGTIAIRGKDMRGIAPNKRPVNLIFQHLALFPMMNVAENIAFGLRRKGENRSLITKKVDSILERVGLPGYGEKQVHQLSGGQRQRVAIARSLVLEPAVLLLDEPLGALDLKLREQMKVELKTLQAQVGTTFIYITHDQSEALIMSDFVAVMNKGRFEQMDKPQNLYAKPATPFVASFVGDNNSWNGTVTAREHDRVTVRTENGNTCHIRTEHTFVPGDTVRVFLRPEAMLIQPDAGISALNRFEVVVGSILFNGANSSILVRPKDSAVQEKELMIALPQNRQYDHVKKGDVLEIGWDEKSGICFAEDAS